MKFVSAYIALGYLAFATVTVLGLLQVLAAWVPLRGLAFADYRRPAWRALGPALIVAAYAWFFGTRREIISPGPAGAELMVLFSGAVFAGVVLTLGAASALRPYRVRIGLVGLRVKSRRLSGAVPAEILRMADHDGRAPGILVLADPALMPAARALAAQLAASGYVAFLPSWPRGALGCAAAKALAAAALEALAALPDVDGADLAVVGHGLGGDLALALGNAVLRPVRAVVALAPLHMAPCLRPGMGLLHEMTYAEAWAWNLGGRRAPLVRSLAAAGDAAASPVLVLLGQADSLVPPAGSAGLQTQKHERRVIPGATHITLATSCDTLAVLLAWLARARAGEPQVAAVEVRQ
ncbi:MAG: hypothetical protein ACUVX9_02280 [Anaerolineae bacterium]